MTSQVNGCQHAILTNMICDKCRIEFGRCSICHGLTELNELERFGSCKLCA